MIYISETGCYEFAHSLGVEVPQPLEEGSVVDSIDGVQVCYKASISKSLQVSRMIVDSLGNFGGALLWITEFGIWPSSENWHLYYKLKSAYGASGDLVTEPGHRFFDYESADLVTFIDIVLRFGWGGHLFVFGESVSYAYLSHDGWLRYECPRSAEDLRKKAHDLGLSVD